MKFSFVSVVVSMYLGVVYIDVFAHYLVLLLYSPIHYFVLTSIVFLPDVYLASLIVPPSIQATLMYNYTCRGLNFS